MAQVKLIEELKRRGYQVESFDTKQEVVDYMTGELTGQEIGIGGSLTVQELGLEDTLRKENKVFWHWNQSQVEECGGPKAVRDHAMQTEVYISSVNAIAETGEIINIDGTGNRIASLAYGHKKVYFIVGENKIAKDFEGAMWRAKNIAAPLNAKRLNRKTPCAVKGDKCYHCNSPERICNGTLILERPMGGTEMIVVLVGEELGA